MLLRAYATILFFAATFLLPGPAFAHRPYFNAESAPVALPGGESGAIRLLNGDGILGPDPIRPIITDASGGVRAIAPVGYAASYSCAARSCRVYVYRNTALFPDVFDTEIASMKSIALLRTADENELDAVLRENEPYFGFRLVPDLSVRMLGALACLAHWWRSFVFLMLAGATALPIWLLSRAALDRRERNRSGAMWLCILFAVAITVPVMIFVLMFLFVSAYPPLLSVIPLALPTALLVAELFRRSRWTAART